MSATENSNGISPIAAGGRRLIAVVYADMVGYSRLIGLDDAGTANRLRTLRRELIDPLIHEHGGRVVQTGGDSLLVAFDSIDGAVRCAVQVQQRIPAHDGDQPPDRRIRFRMGINIGDVIPDGTNLHGDGVNIAARLEPESPVGGICVSRTVRDHVHSQLDLEFEPIGPLTLKNIARPVEAFILRLDRTAEAEQVKPPALVEGFGTRPAIAVLPFRTYGADPDEEYLADGITEDVISVVSRWRSFPVISRGSVFALKGKDLDIRTVGQQLGARYINEGTLRRRGSRLRTTVQLGDAVTMENLFSEQYNCDFGDVFEMQDEIVRAIVGAIEPELLRHERERVTRTPQQNAKAYELFQRGQWHHYRYTEADSQAARAFLRNALAIDPDYAQAAATLSITLGVAAHSNWEADAKAAHHEALALARLAVQADSRDPLGHFALGMACYHSSLLQEAVKELNEAISLNPSYAAAHANLAFTYNYMNRPDEALAAVELAMRLSPRDPRRFLWLPALAGSHYLGGRYRAALAAAQEALTANPKYLPVARYIVASLGQLGRSAEAKVVLPLLQRLDGNIAATEAHLRRYFVDGAVQHILDGLAKAGFA